MRLVSSYCPVDTQPDLFDYNSRLSPVMHFFVSVTHHVILKKEGKQISVYSKNAKEKQNFPLGSLGSLTLCVTLLPICLCLH